LRSRTFIISLQNYSPNPTILLTWPCEIGYNIILQNVIVSLNFNIIVSHYQALLYGTIFLFLQPYIAAYEHMLNIFIPLFIYQSNPAYQTKIECKVYYLVKIRNMSGSRWLWNKWTIFFPKTRDIIFYISSLFK